MTGYSWAKAIGFATGSSRPSLAHRTTSCLRPSRLPTTAGPRAYPANQATWRTFSRTTLLDLALPARRCRTAARAGVLGSGLLAGLNVLPGRHLAETHLTIALVTAIGTWVIAA